MRMLTAIYRKTSRSQKTAFSCATNHIHGTERQRARWPLKHGCRARFLVIVIYFEGVPHLSFFLPLAILFLFVLYICMNLHLHIFALDQLQTNRPIVHVCVQTYDSLAHRYTMGELLYFRLVSLDDRDIGNLIQYYSAQSFLNFYPSTSAKIVHY